MKLLFISEIDQLYGAPTSMFELILTLRENFNIEPIVITHDMGILNEQFNSLSIENYAVGHMPYLVGDSNYWYKKILKRILMPYFKIRYKFKNLRALRIIEKNITLEDVDLIYTNLNRVDIGCQLAKKYNKPHIMHIREFAGEDYSVIDLKKNSINYLNNSVTRFIAISRAVEQAWVRKGINKEKIEMVYNGVNRNNIRRKEENSYFSSKVKIIFVGSISESKQQIQLINALGMVSDEILQRIEVDFWGSGDSNYIAKLVKLVERLNLSKVVTFKGYSKDISKHLHEYDIGVICSRSEGFGRVTVEYMLAGLAIIASNTGANVELVRDNYNGILYEYGKHADLREKLINLINNKQKTIQLGLNGYKRAIENYTKEKNAENIYQIINEVINKEN